MASARAQPSGRASVLLDTLNRSGFEPQDRVGFQLQYAYAQHIIDVVSAVAMAEEIHTTFPRRKRGQVDGSGQDMLVRGGVTSEPCYSSSNFLSPSAARHLTLHRSETVFLGGSGTCENAVDKGIERTYNRTYRWS